MPPHITSIDSASTDLNSQPAGVVHAGHHVQTTGAVASGAAETKMRVSYTGPLGISTSANRSGNAGTIAQP